MTFSAWSLFRKVIRAGPKSSFKLKLRFSHDQKFRIATRISDHLLILLQLIVTWKRVGSEDVNYKPLKCQLILTDKERKMSLIIEIEAVTPFKCISKHCVVVYKLLFFCQSAVVTKVRSSKRALFYWSEGFPGFAHCNCDDTECFPLHLVTYSCYERKIE